MLLVTTNFARRLKKKTVKENAQKQMFGVYKYANYVMA